MNISKSIQRLKWRFTSGKQFLPNENDIEALNEIIEYCGIKEKQQLIDNQLFGKMYIYLYWQFMIYYKCSFVDEIPQKELHKLLNKDLRTLINDVLDCNRLSELELHIKKESSLNGFKVDGYKEIADNFKIMINAAINTYSQKHIERV